MTEEILVWPDDADGDVLRSMQKRDFDFSKSCLIDFNIDFENWPPPKALIDQLAALYPSLMAYEPTDEFGGYLQFQVYEKLSYDLVTGIQKGVSEMVAPYGGICESWGVLH